MTRSRAWRWLWLLGWLAACAPRDVYLGADLADAHVADGSLMDAALPDSGAAAPPAQPPPSAAGTGPIAQAGAGGAAGAAAAPCSTGRADCDSDPANGCETDLREDAAHCGRCDQACQSTDCVCRDGQLQTNCPAGRADCDQNPQNGCEVDTDTSMDHCGACGQRCHIGGHDAVAAVCMSGHCHITCQMEFSPEGDCDGNPDNGCETSLWTNENCGACGVRCLCNAGVCR